jgi:hypothetical protein
MLLRAVPWFCCCYLACSFARLTVGVAEQPVSVSAFLERAASQINNWADNLPAM